MRLRFGLMAFLVLLGMSAQAFAGITRVSGPTDLLGEGLAMVKYDLAYDSANRVYLMVWGTQLAGPVKGLFLNEAGAPVGGQFAISDGSMQSGWARVIYNAAHGKFLVSYTKILGPNQHLKAARFVTYGVGLGPEIPLDSWTGGAGTESGIAYSPAGGGRFFVTWWKWQGNPVSYVATLDTSGNVLAVHQLTNAADGQSDPEIACDPIRNRCLVVGLAWGAFAAGSPSTWGRWIDGSTGIPQGPDSFYLTSWPRLLEDHGIVYSEAAQRLVVVYIRDAAAVGQTVNAADGSVGSPFVMRQTSAATFGSDGGGYAFSWITYNPGSGTILLTGVAWSGFPFAQELNASGAPIDGSLDFVPNNGGAGNPQPWDLRSKFSAAASNQITKEFLLVDNHYFKVFRVSKYSTTGGGPPPPPPPTTNNAAVHDLDGDKSTDLLFRSQGDGALAVWRMNGGAVTGTYFVSGGATTPLGWAVSGAGDLNGDGFADLVWHHSSGPLAVWFMQGATVMASASIMISGHAAVVRDGWEVRGVGDLNGDGRSDLVWQNVATGWLAVWFMNGSNVAGAEFLSVPVVGDLGWKIAGVADLNKDGRADIIWQHANGVVYAWLMNGSQVGQQGPFSIYSADSVAWQVRAVGDTNGDGFADLLWYNVQTGSVAVWYLNGFTVVNAAVLGTAAPGWHMVGPG